jgi:hypothetical protein
VEPASGARLRDITDSRRSDTQEKGAGELQWIVTALTGSLTQGAAICRSLTGRKQWMCGGFEDAGSQSERQLWHWRVTAATPQGGDWLQCKS